MTGIGWDHSAAGWLAAIGDAGDPTRRYVLDAPMLDALPAAGMALDIGCGEGRFCRMMTDRGLTAVGIDPTRALIDAARARDPGGAYVRAGAEALPFADRSFDVAVFYLTLIDIADHRVAIAEAARVLRPGGWLLIANLHDYTTARPRDWVGEGAHWVMENGTRKHLAMDDILIERAVPTGWGDIRIQNYHRPLSAYMGALLGAGLILRRFEDPPFTGPKGAMKDKFERMPWSFFMAWQKPEDA
ncbi:MAG: class I SAM-dependent methyltransferase [Pseudomonadota bacterium]